MTVNDSKLRDAATLLLSIAGENVRGILRAAFSKWLPVRKHVASRAFREGH